MIINAAMPHFVSIISYRFLFWICHYKRISVIGCAIMSRTEIQIVTSKRRPTFVSGPAFFTGNSITPEFLRLRFALNGWKALSKNKSFAQ